MRIKIQVVFEPEAEGGTEPIVTQIASFERTALTPQTLGLSLAEAKETVAAIQKVMTTQQVEEYLEQNTTCPDCDSPYAHKDQHLVVYRTLFGKLKLNSPRLLTCKCQPPLHKIFRPVAELLKERTAPEFLFLQSKWSALMSYGLTSSPGCWKRSCQWTKSLALPLLSKVCIR